MTREEIYNAAFHDELRKIAEATMKMDSGSNILKPEKKIKTGMPGHVKKPTTVQTEVGGIV